MVTAVSVPEKVGDNITDSNIGWTRASAGESPKSRLKYIPASKGWSGEGGKRRTKVRYDSPKGEQRFEY